MTLCPIALAVGCRKCPAFGFCPAKELLGDYRKPEPPAPAATSKTGKKARPSGRKGGRPHRG